MPKNMKYDATAKKAAGPKKKMKSNQDGGSVTAKDPAAAGRELVANQKGAARYSKGPAMGHKKGPAKYDRVVLGGNQGDVSKTKPGKKDYDGGAKMGYSQKFGAGRMNGYDAGAKKVMDVMTYGAGKYMEKGPAQMTDVKSGERVDVTTSSADGSSYKINVAKDAGYHNLYKKLGGIPHNLRPITTFNKNTDPAASGISAEEKTRREKAYQASLKKTDVKSGTEMRRSSYLPKQ